MADDRDRDVWEDYRRNSARDDLSRGVGQGFGFGVGCVVAVLGVFAVGSLVLILIFAIGFGGGPSLGSLREECAVGDMASCDRLFFEAPFFSDDERFGDTCGDRTAPFQTRLCTQIFP